MEEEDEDDEMSEAVQVARLGRLGLLRQRMNLTLSGQRAFAGSHA
jgi:hypothetical protein